MRSRIYVGRERKRGRVGVIREVGKVKSSKVRKVQYGDERWKWKMGNGDRELRFGIWVVGFGR